MKIEFPFNYQIYVGYRRGASSYENYGEVAKVEVPEYSRGDVDEAFSVGRSHAYGQANTPGAVLHCDGRFLVPLSKSLSVYDPVTHATTYEDIPWGSASLQGDSDPGQVQATLSAFLHQGTEKMRATTCDHRMPRESFDPEIKARRGRPNASRVRILGDEKGKHPADAARENMETILGQSLALVDGNFHLVTREPRFEITEVEKRGGLVCNLTATAHVSGLHVYRLDELPTVLDRFKAEGRVVRVADQVSRVEPGFFREHYEETRIVGALKAGFAHLSPRAHRLNREQIERFIDARALVMTNGRSSEVVLPDPDFQNIARRVSTIRDLLDEGGLTHDMPEDLTISDLDQANMDLALSRDFVPDMIEDDLQALLSPPSPR